jgi:hypothetical protein
VSLNLIFFFFLKIKNKGGYNIQSSSTVFIYWENEIGIHYSLSNQVGAFYLSILPKKATEWKNKTQTPLGGIAQQHTTQKQNKNTRGG